MMIQRKLFKKPQALQYIQIMNLQFHLVFPYSKLFGSNLNLTNKKRSSKLISRCSKVLISRMKYILVVGHLNAQRITTKVDKAVSKNKIRLFTTIYNMNR